MAKCKKFGEGTLVDAGTTGEAVGMAKAARKKPLPSENKKDLNKSSTELSDAKKTVNPTVTVDNSQKTIQVGNKPNPRMLMAENKPDYPTFMQPQ